MKTKNALELVPREQALQSSDKLTTASRRRRRRRWRRRFPIPPFSVLPALPRSCFNAAVPWSPKSRRQLRERPQGGERAAADWRRARAEHAPRRWQTRCGDGCRSPFSQRTSRRCCCCAPWPSSAPWLKKRENASKRRGGREESCCCRSGRGTHALSGKE